MASCEDSAPGYASRSLKGRIKTSDVAMSNAAEDAAQFSDLPDELLSSHVLLHLDVADLARVASVSRRLANLGSCSRLWWSLFLKRWEQVTPLQERAAKLAGSWRELYRCRMYSEAEANGWRKPCAWELRAACAMLAERAALKADAATPKATPVHPAAAAAGQLPKHAASSSPPGSPRDPFSAHPALSPSTSRALHTAPSLSLASCPSIPAVVGFPATPASTAVTAVTAGAGGSSLTSDPSAPQAHPSLHPSSSSSSSSMSVMSVGADDESAPADGRPFDPMATDDVTPSASGGPAQPLTTTNRHDESVAIGGSREAHLVYLLDGSGSVSEEDFSEMKRFVLASAPLLCAALGARSTGKVGVVQFSTEPRTEITLTTLPHQAEFSDALEAMARINGGTNIASAIGRAAVMLKDAAAEAATNASIAATPPAAHAAAGAHASAGAPSWVPTPVHPACTTPVPQAAPAPRHPASAAASPAAPRPWVPPPMGAAAHGAGPVGVPAVPARIVLLLTDGRIDGYQAREARATASRLCDEVPGCVLAAFGVGRGVDRSEMLTILGGNAPMPGEAALPPPPPPPPAPHHHQVYQNLYQAGPMPPQPHHPMHMAMYAAMASAPTAPPHPSYHPLYLDLWTRDDAPW